MTETASVTLYERPVDPSTPLRDPIVWQRTSETSWRSTDGAYLIVAQTSPDQAGDLTAFQLRGTQEVGGYGYHVDETYNLRQTMDAAVRDRYCREHHPERSVPDSYADEPGVEALSSFYWPISDGITRGALVVHLDDGGDTVASIVQMSRGESEAGPDGEVAFAPTTLVSVPIPTP